MALAQDEKTGMRFYSLSAQIMHERDAYYENLERTQKGDGDVTEWLLWFLGCFDRAVTSAEKTLNKVLMKAKSPLNGLSNFTASVSSFTVVKELFITSLKPLL